MTGPNSRQKANGTTDLYPLWLLAWTLAWAARCTLPEARDPLWVCSLGLMGAGLAGLWWDAVPTRRLPLVQRFCWAAIAAGLALPLAFGLDWLTQTVLLLAVAVAGLIWPWSTTPASTVPHAATVARAVVSAAYLLAAFHKLNTGFFDPTTSCAEHGQRALVTTAPVFGGWIESLLELGGNARTPILAVTILAVEGVLAAAIRWFPRLLWTLGPLFHLALTVSLAPAFAFAMLPAWVAALIAQGDADRCLPIPRRATWVVALAGLAVMMVGWHVVRDATVGAGVSGTVTSWLLSLKLAVLTGCLAVSLPPVWRTLVGERPATPPTTSRWVGIVAFAGAVTFGLTPYLGTQTQHTGAMLSNLRIDAGCWNHLVVPEAVRRVEPYVRIEHASLGTRPGGYAATVEVLRSRLWTSGALRRMRRNWCTPQTRPIHLAGIGPDGAFEISDLCAPDVVFPHEPGVLGGRAWNTMYLRFQKNLPRQCPVACVH